MEGFHIEGRHAEIYVKQREFCRGQSWQRMSSFRVTLLMIESKENFVPTTELYRV